MKHKDATPDRKLALVTLRSKLDLTQGQLAKCAGVAQSEISRIEQRDDCLVSSLTRYAEALGGKLELHIEIDGRRYPIVLQAAG